MSLPRQPFEIPLDGGLLTRGDKRAKDAPAVERLLNAEFDDIGGARVRFPFDITSNAITGGGTLANARRFAMRGDEQVCFTDTGLYAWVPATNSWTYRGDHLAVMTDEQTVFAQTDDQFFCDRAELNGQVVYAWQSTVGGVHVAVLDKTNGTVIQPPTAFNVGGTTFTRPRLIALSTCVLLVAVKSVPASSIVVFKITLGPYVISAPTSIHAITSGTAAFDVCRVAGRDQIFIAADIADSPRHYKLSSVDSTLTVSTTTANNPWSGDPQQIAVAVSPDALHCTVVIVQGTPKADIWTVPGSGAPVARTTTSANIGNSGTGVTNCQVTAAYRLVTNGGFYRCYVYWTLDESSTTVCQHYWNWIDTSGAMGLVPGTDDQHFVFGLGIGARAFARDSHVYLVGTFGGLSFGSGPDGTHSALQNTYYLYRDDAFLIGKAVWGEGAGFHQPGWLPNVVVDAGNANRFVVMEGIRRIVPVGPNATIPWYGPLLEYAERAPREVAFTFDDNRARRSVQLGDTLYITGSIVLQYDGAALTEVGFCTYPWDVQANATLTAGLPAAGGYSYKATDRWTNGAGEIDRSTTATVSNVTSAGAVKLQAQPTYLYVTRKTGVTIEVWRTKVNPPAGAPFFLVTSQDPSVALGDNRYLANDSTNPALASFIDNQTDATIAIAPANPQNDGTIEPVEPPGASIIMTDSQRIYLAGIPGSPNTVFYSKYRQPGFVAAFNDFLSFDVPAAGGAITALDFLDGGLIVWCETATYQFSGPGYSDAGTGANFTLARTVSTELGAVSQDALNFSNEGWYVKASRGWQLLDKGLNYTDIDSGPYSYRDEDIYAVVSLPKRNQIRVVTPARVLVLDTLVKKWAEWTIADGLDMLIDPNQACWYLTPTGPRKEITTWAGYAGQDTSLTFIAIETTWLKPDGRQQGRYIVDFIQLLGEFRSSCAFQVQIAKDYEYTAPGSPNWHTTETWTPTTTIDGDALELRVSPIKKRCASMKVCVTIAAGVIGPLLGPCARLTSLTGQYAVEPGIYGDLAAAQRT